MKRAFLLFAVMGLSSAALAQTEQRPCAADAARLCANVQAGGGTQLACLKAHKTELSPGCRQKVMQMKVKQFEQQQLEQQQQQQPPMQPQR